MADTFMPGERGGIPEGLLNQLDPFSRFLSILTGSNPGGLSDLSKIRTPGINPNAPTPGMGTAQQPKGSKLDKLMMFLGPAAGGFITSLAGRRRDRMRNFLAGAIGGGVNVLQDVATRPARRRAAEKLAAEEALKAQRATEKHTTDIAQAQAQTAEAVARTGQIGKTKAEMEYKEKKNADGSTLQYERPKGSSEPWRQSMAEQAETVRTGSKPAIGPIFGTRQQEAGQAQVTTRAPFGSAAPPVESKPVRDKDERTGKMVFVEGNPKHPNFGKKIKETQTTAPRPEKPSAGEERKNYNRDVSAIADRAIREAGDLKGLSQEDAINKAQDILRAAIRKKPELREYLRDALDEVRAVMQRQRPPKESQEGRNLRRAQGIVEDQ